VDHRIIENYQTTSIIHFITGVPPKSAITVITFQKSGIPVITFQNGLKNATTKFPRLKKNAKLVEEEIARV
jgi:hypothetical protein